MRKGYFKFLFIISFLTVFMLFPKSVFAESLKFQVEKSTDTAKQGSDITVLVKVSNIGNDSINEYNVTLAYDSNVIEFKSGNSDVAKVEPANPIVITNKVKDGKPDGTLSSDTTLATLVFSAKKAGDSNLTINASNIKTINNKEIKSENISLQNSMVKVVALSSDATLSSLKIPNATISPKFDKNTLEYSTTIQDITEITVNAIATDSNAKIMISDNYKNLQKGDNVVKISVTAEDGVTTKTYVVKVTLNMTPTEEELKKANANLKKLEVKGYNIDFSKDVKKYTLTVPYKITKLDVKAEAENEKASIITQGASNLKVGRNTVKVQVTSEDEKNKEDYTITVTRQEQEKEVVQTCPDTTSKNEWIMFSACMLATFTLGIILGYFLCKKEILRKLFKRKKVKEEEKLSDTIEIKKDDIK